MPTRLTDAERAALATTLPAWEQQDDGMAIHREFNFKDFSEAWGFMARVALAGRDSMVTTRTGRMCGTRWRSRCPRTTPAG